MDPSSLPRSVALVQARAWADQKRWDRVVALIPQLLAENPENLEAYLLATRSSINTSQHLSAKKLSEECLRLGPNNADAHYLAAVAADNVGQLALAQQYLTAALALHPTWAALHQYEARLYTRMGYTGMARQSLLKAKSLAPNNAEIAGQLVDLESKALSLPREVKQTTQRYEDALKLDPENTELHFKLGQHLLELECDYPRATQILAVALRRQPNNEAYRNAYLMALRHSDPFIRKLFAPLRCAQFMDRLLQRRYPYPPRTKVGKQTYTRFYHTGTRQYSTKLEEIFWLLMAIPMMMVWLMSSLIFAWACWFPALIYGRLTLTDFRAQSIGQTPNDNSRHTWSFWPGWLRWVTMLFLVALPWIFTFLILWRIKVLGFLMGGVVGLGLLDMAMALIKWTIMGWKLHQLGASRRFPLTATFYALCYLAILAGLLVVLFRFNDDRHILFGISVFSSLFALPAFFRWNREWIHLRPSKYSTMRRELTRGLRRF
jgi:tetratricopeptide (TPR) repeat protein